MSQTMQQRELKERRAKLNNLIHDVEQIEARIRARKQEGQIISGNKIDFEKLIEKYKQIADRADGDENEQEDIFDDFLSEMEADPSQADLVCIIQKLNQLLISLKYKQMEVKQAQEELSILEGLHN